MGKRDTVVTRNAAMSTAAVLMVCFTVGLANTADAKERILDLARIAVGPVTAVDPVTGSVEVLGQTFVMSAETRGAGWSSGQVALGDYVLAAGLQSEAGISTSIFSRIEGQYVPGASPVYLRAEVDSVDSTLGYAVSGGALVDFTPSLATHPHGPTFGHTAEFMGIQPVLGGAILASSVVASISGGDRFGRSISGGDSLLLSISGGDRSSLSISGGDSSRLSITGGDAAGLSISGGDRARLSISGGDSARQSISGGDSSRLSISGGDSARQSISGGDRARLSISGGDSARQSISGGDRARLSISGGDSARQSISGGDRARLSISGGDSARQSISGGDRR